MITRILNDKQAIRRVLGDDRETSHPTWQDIEVLDDEWNTMSGSNYVTISALKPILHRLQQQLRTELAAKDGDLPMTKSIKNGKKSVGSDCHLFS